MVTLVGNIGETQILIPNIAVYISYRTNIDGKRVNSTNASPAMGK